MELMSQGDSGTPRVSENNFKLQLETCIDYKCQFQTAKRPQAPSDATVQKRFFHDNFVIFVVDQKE